MKMEEFLFDKIVLYFYIGVEKNNNNLWVDSCCFLYDFCSVHVEWDHLMKNAVAASWRDVNVTFTPEFNCEDLIEMIIFFLWNLRLILLDKWNVWLCFES